MCTLTLIVLSFLCGGVLCMGPPFYYPPPYYPPGHSFHHKNHNFHPAFPNYGRGNFYGYYPGYHQHKPGCGHGITPSYPSSGDYDFPDYEDSTNTPDKTTVGVEDKTTLSSTESGTTIEVVTTELIPTTEQTLDIDLRFKLNKTVTKRSTEDAELPTKPTFREHNSLHPFGFWNFPNFDNDYNPGGLSTCVQKKFECVPINKCKQSNRVNNQRFCRWSGSTPYVCCEKQSNNRLLHKHDASCGRKKVSGRSAAIIGGAAVGSGKSYPWMVAIGQIDRDGSVDWFCGGALISANTIVTAAHCIGRRSPDIVRLGEVDFAKPESSPNVQDIYVWRTLAHPSYRPPAMYTDIALLYLGPPAILSQFVRPVCLPQRSEDMSVALLTGWGQLNFDGEKSSVLQEVTVQVFNNTQCDKYYSVGTAAKRNFPRGILDTQMCAGNENGGKDACQGDSGSPLVMEEDGSFVLTGIVSAGIGCGAKMFPGIYTRVSSFVPWILENMV